VDNIVPLNLHEAKCGNPKRPYSSSEVGLQRLACLQLEHNQGKEKLVSLSRGRVNLTVLKKEQYLKSRKWLKICYAFQIGKIEFSQ
jgi:hypothetical protein